MTLGAPLGQALLALATAALVAAALRLAAQTGARGLERIVAAAPIAAAAACVEALVLGPFGAGGEPLWLAGMAIASYALAALRLPPPATSLWAEGADALRGLGVARLAAWGALAGGALAVVAWLLRYPLPGTDSVANHVAIALEWVQAGTPGSVTLNSYDFPTGAYPLTNELLIAWAMGISRSFVPATLLAPAAAALLATSGWVMLRELGVPRHVGALAVASVVSLPLVAGQLGEAKNDVSATAWTACAGALALCARRRPGLAAPALLAAALAAGTKTTVLPLAALAAAIALHAVRHDLRRLVLPVCAAALAGLVAGGIWYARNLIDHGSPLWPFVRGPFGDPLPPLLTLLEPSFLDRPEESLRGRAGDYVDALAGGLLLAVAALVLPLLSRARAALLAGAVAAASILLWMQAPVTGRGDLPVLDSFAIEATRYMLPALAAAAVAVALSARSAGLPRTLAVGALALAAAWNLLRDAQLGFPQLPAVTTVLAGAVAGALAAVAAYALGRRLGVGERARAGPPRSVSAPAKAALCVLGAVAVGALLWPAADGYALRHARTGALDAELVRGLEERERPGDREPVDFVRLRTAMLAGDRLERRLRLLAPDARCHPRTGRWLVVLRPVRTPVRGRPGRLFPDPVPVDRCRWGRRPVFETGAFKTYAPAVR